MPVRHDAARTHAAFKGNILKGTSVWALRIEALTYKRNPPAS